MSSRRLMCAFENKHIASSVDLSPSHGIAPTVLDVAKKQLQNMDSGSKFKLTHYPDAEKWRKIGATILGSGCASDAPRSSQEKWRETMIEKTLEALTDEEWEMIETIRENREDDDFRLLIERKHGVWEIELKSAKVPNLERGTGVDFNQAWVNITETIP